MRRVYYVYEDGISRQTFYAQPDDDTPETKQEPVENTHSDDWGDTEEPIVAPTEGE
jgi:hypothetical protein